MSVKLVEQWIRINVTLKWTAQGEKDQSKQRNGAQLYFTLLFTKIFCLEMPHQKIILVLQCHITFIYVCMHLFVCLFIDLFNIT